MLSSVIFPTSLSSEKMKSNLQIHDFDSLNIDIYRHKTEIIERETSKECYTSYLGNIMIEPLIFLSAK